MKITDVVPHATTVAQIRLQIADVQIVVLPVLMLVPPHVAMNVFLTVHHHVE